ncbi:hypothetical protein [Actinacidiphila reveromycinica]|uniref:hypothetical protein n=1 Tax=Actinacidiphila reveromycinica TaxID=659352 RepID=UPI001F2CD06A|nr:hypothetical protein [Streptomyces sp. SN-593]
MALWSGEREGPMPVVARRDGRGIRYADERSFDRDANGVLWSRAPSQPGRGTPQFGSVHSLRQRIAMAGLRCQICGGPADRTPDGVLWLIDARPGEILPDEEDTAHPPVCRPCAHRSTRVCPHLRGNHTALRVRTFFPSGVNGVLHVPAPNGPTIADSGPIAFGDARLPWVRAHQLIMRLADFAPIDLDDPRA